MKNPHVLAVCRSASHSMSKPSLDHITLLQSLGVEGDAHMGSTVRHRSRVAVDPSKPNLRQVHLIHSELFDELAIQGFNIFAGQLGENITTRDINLLQLSLGTRLEIGDQALIEVTGLRNPCVQLDGLEPGLMEAVLERNVQKGLLRKAGIMAIVIRGGIVKPQDTIKIQGPDGPHQPLKPV